jgi:hypothetical protein
LDVDGEKEQHVKMKAKLGDVSSNPGSPKIARKPSESRGRGRAWACTPVIPARRRLRPEGHLFLRRNALEFPASSAAREQTLVVEATQLAAGDRW